MENQEIDIRGENLKVDNLRTVILNAITSSNLTVGVIYYIFKDMTKELESLYNQQVKAEYNEFCELAKQEEDAAAAQGSQDAPEEETPAAAHEKKEEN